jgi:hypothetical protein
MTDSELDIIYELSIYSIDFSKKSISLLSNNSIHKISITNKKYNTPIDSIIQKIQIINPRLEIIPYYSLKYNLQSSLQDTVLTFIQQLHLYQNLGIKEVLLVSGVPKPKYDTRQVLEILSKHYQSEQLPRLAVAYNPFLTGIDLEIENNTIETKLKSGIISSVYLQIGIDLTIIKESIKYLRQLQPNLNIYLSLMKPTPTRLSQFQYRPWKGVNLPQEYLQSVSNAIKINKSIYNLAQELNVSIIQGD